MNLRPKTTRFIIEALDYRIEAYQDRLKTEDLSEDEESDITNDVDFLESIRTELAQTLKKSDRSKVSDSSDNLSEGVKDTVSEKLVKTVIQLSIDERLLLVGAITSSIRQELQHQAQESSEEYSAATGKAAVVAS